MCLEQKLLVTFIKIENNKKLKAKSYAANKLMQQSLRVFMLL